MIFMKYTGRIVFMTAVALVLIASALSMPWYESEMVYEYPWYGTTRTSVTIEKFYLEYSDSSAQGLQLYWDFDEDVIDIMHLEKDLIYCWLIAGLLFLGAVLMDMRLAGLILGWATLLICLFAVMQFAGRIKDAMTPPGWGTTTYAADIGFVVAIAATALQIIAVLARTYVVYPDIATRL